MRYTTIIDIRENHAVYRNQNARLVYLHLVLASGYHDTDRDIADISLRALAEQTGITLSATRHALTQLERAGLLERTSDRKYHVKKWILDEPPSPRPRKAQAAAAKAEGQIGKRWENEIAEYRQKVMGAIRASSRDELTAWLQELEEGHRKNHRGVSIAPNTANIEWMRKIVATAQ